jgi:hypothetical protein
MRRPTASFWLAFLIVSVAMVVALVTTAAHPGEFPEVPRIALAIKPAWWVAFFFGGGPHSDVTGEWWYIVPVTFVIALAMWWAVLEGCRRLWNLRRR